MSHKVFIYGTLKRGRPLHGWTIGSEFLGDVTTHQPMFTLMDLGAFPGLVKNGTKKVRGELYNMPEEYFIDLKYMEEVVGYRTGSVTVEHEDGRVEEAETFFWNYADWCEWLNEIGEGDSVVCY